MLELRWESPGLALGTVTYENDRKLLQAFLEYWEKKPKT